MLSDTSARRDLLAHPSLQVEECHIWVLSSFSTEPSGAGRCWPASRLAVGCSWDGGEDDSRPDCVTGQQSMWTGDALPAVRAELPSIPVGLGSFSCCHVQ